MITRTTYCTWDGDPAILAYHDDGRILAFTYKAGAWRSAHGAEIAIQAPVIGKVSFEDRWPDLKLPAWMK